jgi:hypothetical protein
VTVDSVVGCGTTFSISLPFGKRHLPSERISDARGGTSSSFGASSCVEEELRWLPDTARATDCRDNVTPGAVLASDPGRRSTTGDATRARILVADDNADMRDYVARLLSAQYDVHVVRDGSAAMTAARHRPPDLIVADVMMPVLGGVGLLRDCVPMWRCARHLCCCSQLGPARRRGSKVGRLAPTTTL